MADHDIHLPGEGGTARQALRRAVRLPLLAGYALLGLMLQFGFYLLRPLLGDDRLQRETTRRFHRGLCALVGLRLEIVGRPPEGAALVVSNHISWLDVPVIGGCLPVAFLSKSEVRRWPVIGWLATNAGTHYIDRGAHGVRNVAQAMSESLRQGRCVAFFPEGTTTAGESVRRFLPPLFAAAVEAGVPVQPVAIRYPHGDSVHPYAPLVGDQSMATHVWRLLGGRRLQAEVTFCPPIAPLSERRLLAVMAHHAICQVVARRGPGQAAVGIGVGETSS